jgi:hypothetical protein
LEVLLVLPYRPPFEEKQLHDRFASYRKQGEWFEYTGDLKAFIEEKIKDPSPSPKDDQACFNKEKARRDDWAEKARQLGFENTYADKYRAGRLSTKRKETDELEVGYPRNINSPYERWESSW